MDIQMPDIDGYEATKRIIEKGIKTPIVAITANAVKGDREKCLEIGMQDYLAKPINAEKIYKIIEKLISNLNSASKI